MSEVLVHDPELAHMVFEAAKETVGVRNKSYSVWLNRFVKPVAQELGYIFDNPYDGKRKLKLLTVKIPIKLMDELDDLAKRLGITRSELVRQVLFRFIVELKNEYKKVNRLEGCELQGG
ncbi:MAG: ribbon-helix-helix domain-containing protein [Desulfurococcales archaeon]|nr:ribbon-helix-helix domain-containing protein [Desulfurococcales archaeon]